MVMENPMTEAMEIEDAHQTHLTFRVNPMGTVHPTVELGMAGVVEVAMVDPQTTEGALTLEETNQTKQITDNHYLEVTPCPQQIGLGYTHLVYAPHQNTTVIRCMSSCYDYAGNISLSDLRSLKEQRFVDLIQALWANMADPLSSQTWRTGLSMWS
jgi:hypothetical protein